MPGERTRRLGAVELTVSDLDRSVAFYQDAIGLRQHRREGSVAAMGAGDGDLVVLHESPTARRAGRHAGLYHYALLFPTREAVFVAMDGYHHHVGYNLWRGPGVPPAPADAVGLRHWTLAVDDVDALRSRLGDVKDTGAGFVARDPAGIAVHVVAR